MSEEIATIPNAEIASSDHGDFFSLKLKPEFVLKERHQSLPPLPSTSLAENRESQNDSNDKSVASSKNRKNRGQHKKRPRDSRIDNSAKLCLAILRGEECKYGDQCRFPHDMKAYMASRPEDIKEVGICPIFSVTGKCPFGASCRIGSSHINMATGQNIDQSKEFISPPVINILSKDIQTQLRKRIYPFKCKRYDERKVDKISSEIQICQPTNDDIEANVTGTLYNEVGEKTQKSDGLNASGVDTYVKVERNHFKKDEAGDNLVQSQSETNLKLFNTNEVVTTSSMNTTDMSPLPGKTRKIIDFSNKVYIAPLTTVGNLPFRRIMKRFGADITCGEMALAQCLLDGKASELALLKRHAEEDIFGVQIAAGFPDMYTRTMELVENHTVVDFVDLNLGCPLDLVCDKGSGASLMLRDKKFKECLHGITKVLSCPVTIKMRIGWDEKKPFAHNLVSKIQRWQYPSVGAIMIHGRSRLQRYSKAADWDYIGMVADSIDPSLGNNIPIIGNGDILNYTDYEEKVLSRKGLSTCAMLARGALIKPWLPTEIKERRHWDISATERLDILKDFVRFGLENWGSDQQGVNNCRRFLLEWLSFLHRYIPIGLLEQQHPQQMNQRPPTFMCGRNDLETLFLSSESSDWVKISEMLLGPVPDDFKFEPKHKSNSYGAQQGEG